MALNANNVPTGGGKTYPAMEEGVYPARVVHIIDCGVQQQEYMGEKKDPRNEIGITYEFADEFLPDDDGNEQRDKPRHLTETFAFHNLSSEKAKSTIRYYSIDPKGAHKGVFSELIGTPVNVSINAKENTKGVVRNYITSVSPVREKQLKDFPELVQEPKVFDMDDPDVEVFLSLPKFIQDKIRDGIKFEGSKLDELLQEHEGEGAKEEKSEKKASKKAQVEEEAPESEDEEW